MQPPRQNEGARDGVRKIIHVDMDCFFAAIEMRDNPSLRGTPIAVGGHPSRRGVIATANYEARGFGVTSAMASARAVRLCPRLRILAPRFAAYKAESERIRAIFHRFTPLVEPLSLDEAYLDVSGNTGTKGSATLIAQEIRRLIQVETGLTASAGVAPNKFLAKVASDWNKPNGQKVVPPQAVEDFVRQLPVRKIPGVGKVSAQRMHERGVHTCCDLQRFSVDELIELFGKWGRQLYGLCRGQDERAVATSRERKSLSVEHTFVEDLSDENECMERVPDLFIELLRRIDALPVPPQIKSLFAKVKFADFQSTTVERSDVRTPEQRHYERLIAEAVARRQAAVRLMGIGIRLATARSAPRQLSLWPEQVAPVDRNARHK